MLYRSHVLWKWHIPHAWVVTLRNQGWKQQPKSGGGGGGGGEVLTDHSSNFDKIITIFHLIITMKLSNTQKIVNIME